MAPTLSQVAQKLLRDLEKNGLSNYGSIKVVRKLCNDSLAHYHVYEHTSDKGTKRSFRSKKQLILYIQGQAKANAKAQKGGKDTTKKEQEKEKVEGGSTDEVLEGLLQKKMMESIERTMREKQEARSRGEWIPNGKDFLDEYLCIVESAKADMDAMMVKIRSM